MRTAARGVAWRGATSLAALLLLACPASGPLEGVGGDADALVDTIADSVADADADSTTDADADSTTDADTDSNPVADTDADSAADSDTDADAATDSDADADAGTDAPNPCPEGSICVPEVFVGFCEQGMCDEDGECVVVDKPGCCFDDGDCDPTQAGACEAVRCISNACEVRAIPGCCVADDGACADELGCTTDLCGPGGRCQRCPTDGCTCPVTPVTFQTSFDTSASLGALGFSVVDYQSQDAITWKVDQTRWASPPGSLYLGDPACRTYHSGPLDASCQPTSGQPPQPVRVILYSPTISMSLGLPASGAGKVVLWNLWADVEPTQDLGAAEPDLLRVAVDDLSDAGLSWPVATSQAVGKSTGGAWKTMGVDLAPFDGSVVRLRFEFDTFDGIANDYEGLYLDDYQVVDKCAGGCCETDADCAGLTSSDPCRSGRCVTLSDGAGKVCAVMPTNPGEPCEPCSSNATCDDGIPCTSDVCQPSGVCSHDVFCCFEETAWTSDFEQGLAGWYVEDAEPDDGVSWHVTTAKALDGVQSLRFGDPDTGTYDTGAPVSGAARSTLFTVPTVAAGAGAPTLRFWLNLDTEWSDAAVYDNPGGLDRLSVQVGNGQLAEVWSSDAISGTTGGAWTPIEVDLTDYAGQDIQLRFVFDSGDEAANAYAGPFIDGVEVRRVCP